MGEAAGLEVDPRQAEEFMQEMEAASPGQQSLGSDKRPQTASQLAEQLMQNEGQQAANVAGKEVGASDIGTNSRLGS